MIRGSLTAEQNNNLTCLHVEDSDYNRMDWVRNVRTEVARVRANKNIGSDISLIGHAKDHTSYYLKLFRPWKSINVKNYLGINASDFRNAYFGNNSDDLNAIIQDALIPGSVKTFLNDFRKTTEYTDLVNEWNIVTRYKKSWEVAPYAPTFVTTDACVIHAGHILLIKRGAHPGKGLWAMPGGFLEQTETVETGTFRELKEETRIKVPPAILKSSLVTTRHFDAPFRSARGREQKPDELSHQELVEIGVEQRPNDRVNAEIVIVRPAGEIDSHVFKASLKRVTPLVYPAGSLR
jgi:bifunctional NMN adenylyltransferase/nudix hydrolase